MMQLDQSKEETAMHTHPKRLIAVAAAAVIAVAMPAVAQYQVDRSRANDANPRAGSGGFNNAGERARPWETQNDIVYGNVTGGKQFRDQVGSRDPFAFRGQTAGVPSDNFVRDSAGVTTNGFATYNAQQTRAYYGDSRAAPPPVGFVQVPGGGGYVPPRPSAWNSVDPRTSSLSDRPEYLLRSDAFNMAGPVDTVYAPNAVTVSPVFRGSAVNPIGPSDYTQLNSLNGQVQNSLTPTATDDSAAMTARAQGRPAPAQQSGPNTGQSLTGQANTPADGVNNQVMNQTSGDSARTAGPAADAPDDRLEASSINEADTAARRAGVPAGQGALYERLVRIRKAQLGNRPGADADAERMASSDLRRRTQRIKQGDAANDDQPTPRREGGGGAPMGNPPAGGNNGADKTPMKVTTLSGVGVAAGVNDALKKAETQLREGKFASALDTYETAERQLPNSPLIKLGKTHAELGGGFYRRAEGDLRSTFTADQNLLAGQYDLRGFLGDERLQIVEKDLRDQVQKNEKDAGPAILLAYVYYNTANERRAAALLDVADKRTGGKDPFVKLLKQNWALPAIEGGDNK
jgi:hypothetical protein